MIRRLRALALGQVTSEGEEKKDEEGGPHLRKGSWHILGGSEVVHAVVAHEPG